LSDWGLRFEVSGWVEKEVCLRVSGFKLRTSGVGFQVSSFGFWVSGFGCRVSGFGFGVGPVGEEGGEEPVERVDDLRIQGSGLSVSS